jgi:hypothetical protein
MGVSMFVVYKCKEMYQDIGLGPTCHNILNWKFTLLLWLMQQIEKFIF